MAITNAGLAFIAGAITGTGTLFNNANSKIGVGDGTAANAAGQTDLQGTNKFRKAMDVGYPVVSGAKVTFKSTFAPADANFAWNEWGIFNSASAGTMLNRVLETNGIKLSTQTWILQVDITFVMA